MLAFWDAGARFRDTGVVVDWRREDDRLTVGVDLVDLVVDWGEEWAAERDARVPAMITERREGYRMQMSVFIL